MYSYMVDINIKTGKKQILDLPRITPLFSADGTRYNIGPFPATD